MSLILETYLQDPNETLDYSIDWSAWLPTGDVIASSEWTISPSGPTISRKTVDVEGKIATCFVNGITLGNRYKLSNTITTTPGDRIAERSITIKAADR